VTANDRNLRLFCVAVGAFFAAQGLWAFAAPRSFYDALATFEPYNAHFVRDIGAIQAGVGIGGAVAGLRTRAVVAGLAGLASFQVLHVVSHVVDRDAGGRPGFDLPALGAVALVTALVLAVSLRRA
jgi:hypothetical protein